MTKIAEAWLELTRIIAKESGTYKADVPGVADSIEGAIRALALAVLDEIDRLGESVECTTCCRAKAPVGRSVPLVMAGGMCDQDCSGYCDEPAPDQLWAGEWASEFGYTDHPFDRRIVAVREEINKLGEKDND